MRFSTRSALLIGSAWLLAACAAGPDYVRPPTETASVFKEAGDWKEATPRVAEGGDVWGRIYGDSVLSALLNEAEAGNQNLKAADAAWREARAVADETNATLFPSLTLNASGTRSGVGDGKKTSSTTHKLGLGASWEPDLWGSTRRAVESDEAAAQEAEAKRAGQKLSVQAALATAYFNMRAADALKDLLTATVSGYERSLKIAENQYAAGIASQGDVDSAKTQLENAKAARINADLTRAKNEHAIAVLLGKPPALFSLAAMPLAGDAPPVPAEVPSFLLERRPDIAASERAAQAANAQIGVATAAFFPNITLSASAGYSAATFSKLLQASNSFWSFGPALAQTLFDAGARESRLEQSRAAFDQSVATYRQTVLDAFQEVEDNLKAQSVYLEQEKPLRAALASAERAEKQALNQYREGLVPYSSVVTAQVARLTVAENLLALRQNRFVTSASLIAALGGGWEGFKP